MDAIASRQFIRLALLGLLLALTGSAARGAERINTATALAAATVKPIPTMPPLALQLKIFGAVQLDVTIGEEGTVEGCQVLRGNPILAKAAQETVKKWRFKPFKRDDKAIQVITELNFEFR